MESLPFGWKNDSGGKEKFYREIIFNLFKIISYLFWEGRAARADKITIKFMAKMTKAQIMAALAEKTGMKKSEVVGMMDAVVTMAYSEVKKNGEFVLPGFGKMVKVQRKERMGRNPATGESIKIPAKTVVKFRLSKAAKEAVL
jgi:DNA-binding protein HU-beta